MAAANILITGASGGIGSALARAYAAPGTHLTLWGRNEERLNATATACRDRGASVELASFDLQDIASMISRIEDLDARSPVSLAILNAGVGGASSHAIDPPARVLAVTSINFTAAVVGAAIFGNLMEKRRRGHIILIGSIADSFPLPMAPVYSGAKAGLAMFADALRLRLMKFGVGVTLVAPGFIDTAMSQSLTTPRPFLMTADAAAALIKRKATWRRRRLVFPWPFMLLQMLPGVLVRTVLRWT